MAEYPERRLVGIESGWIVDEDTGAYSRIPGAVEGLELRTNKSGWLYDPNVKTFKAPGIWPEANDPPVAGYYQDRHPTRYTWREDVESWARYLVDNYDCWVNTYYDHPEGYWRTETSIDVWGPAGRNDPLAVALGDEIWSLLFYYEGKPDIDWIIWRAQIWTRGGGFQPFGTDDFSWHYDHIHVTYL